MDLQHYHEYQRLKAEGRKQDACIALEQFIASFVAGDDKQAWVHEFLEGGDYAHRIQHQLYEHVIFPELFNGYQGGDTWSAFWLAKTAQNLYASPALHALIGFKSKLHLLREVYQLEPENEEVRQSLLEDDLKWFDYCQHEWPTGILFGANGATAAECEEILEEISFARKLEIDAMYESFLLEFERRTREYQGRVRKLEIKAA